MTLRGTLAAVAGSFLIATVAGSVSQNLVLGLLIATGGIVGALLDSLAGELVQERRYCPSCNVATEARVHRCGTPTGFSGGIRGVTNDVVNVMCTATGAVIGSAALLFV